MKVILRWAADLACGLAALAGALLVGWNAIEIYYPATERVQPDIDQPPLTVAVSLLIFGIVLLLGGWTLRKKLRSTSL